MNTNRLIAGSFVVLTAFAMACGGSADNDGPGAGHLTVAVQGLEPGVAADLLLTGPDGVPVPVTETETLENLVAGDYTLAANPVASNPYVYDPTQPTQALTVVAGDIAFAEVVYDKAAFQDPQNDAQAVPGTRYDVQELRIERQSDRLRISATFAQEIDVLEGGEAATPDHLIAAFELDLDQNGTTGFASAIDGVCPTTLGLGFEFIVVVTVPDADGLFPVLDETATEIARIPASASGNVLSVELPYTMIGTVDYTIDAAGAFGNAGGDWTDCTPDGTTIEL